MLPGIQHHQSWTLYEGEEREEGEQKIGREREGRGRGGYKTKRAEKNREGEWEGGGCDEWDKEESEEGVTKVIWSEATISS